MIISKEEKKGIVQSRLHQAARQVYENELMLKIEQVVGKNQMQIDFYAKAVLDLGKTIELLELELVEIETEE